MQQHIGEHFILGFRGLSIPDWLRDFSGRHSLGGVIVFDYDFQEKNYHNNIESKAQLSELCKELHSLNGSPLIYVDQEGGRVRRLKEDRGFTALPSQEQMNRLTKDEQLKYLIPAFTEMNEIGIDVNLAPVIDLNINPENPDIGKVERSYSNNIKDVENNFKVINQVAKNSNVGLCLKHYPGLGGATVNSHKELTDLTDSVPDEQIQLFTDLAKEVYGHSILISHGILRNWDAERPCSISKAGLGELRKKLPDTLLLTDDVQMQGLQKIMNTAKASEMALQNGADLICIGNNLLDQEEQMLSLAEQLEQKCADDASFKQQIELSQKRILLHKKLFR